MSVAAHLPAHALRTFAGEALVRALQLLGRGAGAVPVAQALGAGLTHALGFAGMEIARTTQGGCGLLFAATLPPSTERSDRPLEVASQQGAFVVRCHAPPEAPTWNTLLGTVAALCEVAEAAAVADASRPPPSSLEPAVCELEAELARVAPGDLRVMIGGETGCGKEVMARRLHTREGPLVALNCAALPTTLLEAELFGVEGGFATGVKARPGRFELAHGGTLFLDEIGDMSLESQAKVLRVLEEGEVYRLGAARPRPAAPRIVTASHRDLEAMVAEGSFRADLYHRLAGWKLTLLPLRYRRADIVNLAAYFLDDACRRQGFPSAGISQPAADRLLAYEWPGNIRQLKREMERAALFVAPAAPLALGELQEAIRCEPRDDDGLDLTLAEHLRRVERRTIMEALAAAGGDVRRAAEGLATARSTLYRRMGILGINAAGEEEPCPGC